MNIVNLLLGKKRFVKKKMDDGNLRMICKTKKILRPKH